MSFQSGYELGPYQILGSAGAGGMGEVYKARDTRLNRTVAIKVLPASASCNSEAKQRLEREAQAIASLNHPNICVLHDIGFQNGIDFLVMEYLDGDTLAAVLGQGPLPMERALRIGVEIADALAKAHARGVVHRDLKPGNIMITKSGSKLLDFGLAKLREAAGPVHEEATALTRDGAIVGTLQYMSPEQLDGEEADARSDIWAFGALLYEMTTGQKAFSGKSQASLISSIMSSAIRPASQVRPVIPQELDHLIDRCLTRDPDARWQSAHDLKLEIEWLAAHPSTGKTAAVQAPVRFGRERVAWIGVSIALLIALAGVSLQWFGSKPLDPDVVRFTVGPPENVSFAGAGASGATSSASISPDGRYLAFVGLTAAGAQQLFIRSLESMETRIVPESETATAPFWSPDSRYIGFTAGGKLRKADMMGGRPETMSDLPAAYGAAWSKNGVIVLAARTDGPLSRATAQGGPATPLTPLEADETAQRWPYFLPDGQHFLYTSFGTDGASIWVAALDSTDKRKLGLGTRPFYASGYLFFVREAALIGQPFDPERLEFTGESFRISDQVEVNVNSGNASYSVSNTNRLAFRPPDALGTGRLIWIDRSGKQIGTLGESGTVLPSLSPDQKRVVVSREPNNDLWMADLERATFSRFTFDKVIQVIPIWAPDGKRVLFRSSRTGTGDLYIKDANGTAPEEALLKSPETKSPTDWSSDGRYIMYEVNGDESRVDLWVLPVSGDRKPQPYLRGPFNEQQGRFSPDGHWVAYTSDEGGGPQIYVQGFPDPSGKWQISSGGGADPRWSRDGKELFYISADQRMMSVAIEFTGGKIQAGIPEVLFPVRVTGLTDTRTHYAVTQDSRRFLVNTRNESSAVSPITVVLNWPSAVKR